MSLNHKIQSALIAAYRKDKLKPTLKKLNDLGVKIYATGGTEAFISRQGIDVIPVEQVTDYPAVFGGRVKTLHPKIFGGILYRRDNRNDLEEVKQYAIPSIDLVIVDLYPFEETAASGAAEEDIIEKIDIGGVALIRAAAKNYSNVLVVSSECHYGELLTLLDEKKGETSLEDRKLFAVRAFDTSSHYDTAIFNYMNTEHKVDAFKISSGPGQALRYGENPHQRGYFYGDIQQYFEQVNGKEISYNNLTDVEAAMQLIAEFGDEAVFAILKHHNACGIATGNEVSEAYRRAYSTDPISAFGGVLITNKEVDAVTLDALHTLFFEVLIAPSFSLDALTMLKQKKNRILLIQKKQWQQEVQYKGLLNGTIVQDHDVRTEKKADLKVKTKKAPTLREMEDLVFATKVCKHSKSNAIILVREGQMLSSGVGQTSRVDALQQAIEKAKRFGCDLQGAVMASDAFFPFPDCVEIAHKAGITSIVQPGGSVKDQLSIDYCNANDLSMAFTGVRHFKH